MSNKLFLYGEELLVLRPTPKLEDYSLSAVRDCLFNIFAATLHIWRPSPPPATRRLTITWWKGNLKPEGKRPLGRPRRRWEDNIRMNLREVGVDWMYLAQEGNQWRAFVNTAVKLRVP